MSAGHWFWIIYVICAIFGGFTLWGADRRFFGGGLVIFILIGLLGWGMFGPPLK